MGEPVPGLEISEAHYQYRRLGVDGLPQLFLRSLKAEPGQGKPQDLICAVEDLPGFGGSFVEVMPHAHPLGTLAWKDKSRL
jgi:hypothetical protein